MTESSDKNPLGGIGEAFSDRNFRILSIGSIASWVSFFVQLVAVSWLTWELTKSTSWLATVALLDIVPNVVLMPLAGALADRYDRYWIMAITSFLALIQAIVIASLAWLEVLTIVPLAILVLIHGIIISFMVPAMYGMLPRFVGKSRLTSAIAVNSSYAQLAVFIGPALAGWVIASYGVTAAFVINALGYVIYLIVMLFLKTPEGYVKPKKSPHSILGDIKEGIDYIRNHDGISSLLVLLLAGDALGASVYYMVPAYSEQILGMGLVGISIILAAKGFGATIAALWIAHGGEKLATPNRMLWAFLAFILSVFSIYFFENLYISIGAFVVLGLAAETYHTIMTSIVQLSVRDEQRGRVMGSMFMLAQFAAGLGTYLIGALAVSAGLVKPMMVATAICFAVWLYYYLRRKHFIYKFKKSYEV